MRATTRAAPPPINPLRFNRATSSYRSEFTVESSVGVCPCQVNVRGVESAPTLTLPLTSFYVHLTLRPLTGQSREAYKNSAGKSHPDLHPVLSSSLHFCIVERTADRVDPTDRPKKIEGESCVHDLHAEENGCIEPPPPKPDDNIFDCGTQCCQLLWPGRPWRY